MFVQLLTGIVARGLPSGFPQEGKSPIPAQPPADGVFLPPPKHHPLLDELLKLFSGSFQMPRTKPYIVTMTVTGRSFLGNKEPLKGLPLISESDRSHSDAGHLKNVSKWHELCL